MSSRMSVRSRWLIASLMVFVIGLAGTPREAAAQWTTGGPRGMGIQDLEVHPGNPDLLYWVDGVKGVYKSVNGGTTISASADGLADDDRGMFVVATHPMVTGIVYAAGKYFYRSDDGGLFWHQIGNGLPPPPANSGSHITAILIDPHNANVIYVGTNILDQDPPTHLGGVYKSIDGGQNFADVTPAGIQVFRATGLAMDPLDSETVYASLWGSAIGGGVWVTRNGGATWSQPAANSPEGTCWSVATDRMNHGRVLAGGDSQGIWISDDFGQHWHLALGLTWPSNSSISAEGSNIFFASVGGGLRRSVDGGGAWQHLTNSIPEHSLTAVSHTHDRVYAGGVYTLSLYRSDDLGEHFTQLTNGFPGISVQSVATSRVLGSRVGYAGATGYVGPFRTENNGASWREVEPVGWPFREISCDPDNADLVLAMFFDIDFVDYVTIRSLDGGLHFSTVDDNPFGLGEIAFDRGHDGWVYQLARHPMGSWRVSRSQNDGLSWTMMASTGLGGTAKCLYVDPAGRIYVGTTSGIYRSVDSGATFQAWGLGIPPGSTIVSLTLSGLGDFYLEAATATTVYRNDGTTATWTSLGNVPGTIQDILGEKVGTIVNGRLEFTPGLFAATAAGVWSYAEVTRTWTRLSTQFGQSVKELAISRPSMLGVELNSVLHAATSSGVWEWRIVPRPITGQPLAQKSFSTSDQLRVSPNPCALRSGGGPISVQFATRADGPVDVAIFDVSGRRVATLLNAPQRSGSFDLQWSGRDDDGRSVPAGIYFTRLRADGAEQTQRLVLLK